MKGVRKQVRERGKYREGETKGNGDNEQQKDGELDNEVWNEEATR